ncbi:MAG: hypothetical protein KDA80_09870 [Planctomycetaceae bacterium]|nr:hypothetical protein [Planctomycetaceae bacterium]
MVVMLSFGVVMVLALWAYWELYTRPFRDLQYAIAARYPDSSPRVIGGRHKSHKEGSVKTLRIVVRIPNEEFDPTDGSSPREERALELYRLAKEYKDVSGYEQVEIHLFQPVPEDDTLFWSAAHSVPEWEELADK